MHRANGSDLPSVSIIIAAFCASDFIQDAIRSALNQGEVDVEVLVVDDCSDDDTVQIVEGLAAQDARVRLLRMEQNSGPAVARNHGIQASHGHWLSILDADDAFMPGRLRYLIDAAEKVGADIVADTFYVRGSLTGTKYHLPFFFHPKEEVLDCYRFLEGARPGGGEEDFGMLKPVIRSSFLQRTAVRYPSSIRHGEDLQFALELLLAGAKYLLIREPFYVYTARSSGASRTTINYEHMIALTEAMKSLPRMGNDIRLYRLLEVRAAAIRDHLQLMAIYSVEKRFGRSAYLLRLTTIGAGRRFLWTGLKRKLRKQMEKIC